ERGGAIPATDEEERLLFERLADISSSGAYILREEAELYGWPSVTIATEMGGVLGCKFLITDDRILEVEPTNTLHGLNRPFFHAYYTLPGYTKLIDAEEVLIEKASLAEANP